MVSKNPQKEIDCSDSATHYKVLPDCNQEIRVLYNKRNVSVG